MWYVSRALIYIVMSLMASPIALASGNANDGAWLSQYLTQAGYCIDCAQGGLQSIDLNNARAASGKLEWAIQEFKAKAAKYGPDCLNKHYIVITDLSRGTGNNMTYILVKSGSTYKVVDQFQTGEGKGVGNVAESNYSPTGLMRLDGLSYRGPNDEGKIWQPFDFGSGRVNQIVAHGLEPNNRNIASRGAKFHPITYSTGSTTNGCKGFPLDKFKKWAPYLGRSCAYNYKGGLEV